MRAGVQIGLKMAGECTMGTSELGYFSILDWFSLLCFACGFVLSWPCLACVRGSLHCGKKALVAAPVVAAANSPICRAHVAT